MNTSKVAHQEIVEFVLAKVAMRTKRPLDSLTSDTDLASVGMDSLNAVLVCGYLEHEYELELEPMVMFQYKTAEQVAHAVLNLLMEK